MDLETLAYRLEEIAKAFDRAEQMTSDLIDDAEMTKAQKATLMETELGSETIQAAVCRAIAKTFREQKDAA
jgi:hypothetical protein